MKSIKVLYPGSFDPYHYGHHEVVQSLLAKDNFDITIGIFKNPSKIRMFEVTAVMNQIHTQYRDNPNVTVAKFDNDRVAYHTKDFDYIVRGVRDPHDTIQELKQAKYYLEFYGIHTLLIPTTKDISSTTIRELIKDQYDTWKKLVPCPEFIENFYKV